MGGGGTFGGGAGVSPHPMIFLNPQKSETVIDTCVSLIKQDWKKMTEIPQKRDFLTRSIQNFIRKVKQFVTKYYIT